MQGRTLKNLIEGQLTGERNSSLVLLSRLFTLSLSLSLSLSLCMCVHSALHTINLGTPQLICYAMATSKVACQLHRNCWTGYRDPPLQGYFCNLVNFAKVLRLLYSIYISEFRIFISFNGSGSGSDPKTKSESGSWG